MSRRIFFTRPHGIYNAGEDATFDDAVAERLINGGAAVDYDARPVAEAVADGDAAEAAPKKAAPKKAAAAALPQQGGGGDDSQPGGAGDDTQPGGES